MQIQYKIGGILYDHNGIPADLEPVKEFWNQVR